MPQHQHSRLKWRKRRKWQQHVLFWSVVLLIGVASVLVVVLNNRHHHPQTADWTKRFFKNSSELEDTP